MTAQTELKPYDEIRTAKNAYKLIVESGRSIESVALDIQASDRLIYYWANGEHQASICSFTAVPSSYRKHPRLRVLFVLNTCS